MGKCTSRHLFGTVEAKVSSSQRIACLDMMAGLLANRGWSEHENWRLVNVLKDPSQPRLCFCLHTGNHDNPI